MSNTEEPKMPDPIADAYAQPAHPGTGDAALPAVRNDEQTDALMTAWKDGPEERAERLPAVDRWNTMEAIAKRIASSTLLPTQLRSGPDREANVMVLLLTAHDLGISATTAMQKVHIIDGKPSMGAELMRSLILRDGHGLQIQMEHDADGTPIAATVRGWRKEMPEVDVSATFTWEEARLAGLVGKDNWKKHPADMLVARATSRFARYYFPDCLSGVSYTPDELEAVPNLAAPPREAAHPGVIAGLRVRVEAITDDEVRRQVAAAWKAARLGSLKEDPGQIAPLAADEVAAATALIEQAERDMPAEAEIVEPDPTRVPDGGGAGDQGHPAENSGEGFSGDSSDEGSVGVPSLTPDKAPRPVAPSPESSLQNAAMVASYGDGRPQTTVPAPPCLADADETAPDAPLAASPPVEAHPAPDAAAHTVEAIEAEVAAMPLDAVHRALEADKKSTNGTPKVLRKRLVAHLIASRPF